MLRAVGAAHGASDLPAVPALACIHAAEELALLEKGRTVYDLKRKGLLSVQDALDDLITKPTYGQLCMSAVAIRTTPGLTLYRQEA